MYMIKCILVFLLVFFLYKSKDDTASFVFIATGTAGIIIGWFLLPSRNDIFAYLKKACFDNIPGYDYMQSVNLWITSYDNTLKGLILLSVIIGIICIMLTLTGNVITDNTADFITYFTALVVPVLMLIFTIKYAGKYVDPSHVYFPPLAKGELVLAASTVIRKIIKVYKN